MYLKNKVSKATSIANAEVKREKLQMKNVEELKSTKRRLCSTPGRSSILQMNVVRVLCVNRSSYCGHLRQRRRSESLRSSFRTTVRLARALQKARKKMRASKGSCK
mmetsp:Transcript_5326/g.11282  ORF Transcript_5326/g.11282 Transcript_5326/m.11282 type:complete len:106 (+) Transcript_5326:1359-1676(+)